MNDKLSNVIGLPGHPLVPPDGEVDQEIVDALEELLKKAKAGQIRAFAWCAYKATDALATGWHPGAFGFHLCAAICSLQHDYMKTMCL